MNEAIPACRFFKVEGSYMLASTVFGVIILVTIKINAAIPAGRFFKVDASFMRVSTV